MYYLNTKMPEFGNNFFKDVQDFYRKNEKTLSYS